MSSDRRFKWLSALGWAAVAFAVRLVGLGMSTGVSGDEASHLPSATAYTWFGALGPDNWYTPPLKHVMLWVSLHLFGTDPGQYRLQSALAGATTVAVVFLLTLLVASTLRNAPRSTLASPVASRGRVAASFAAGLVALDPLHTLFSRTTFEDVPSTFFIVLGIYLGLVAILRARASSGVLRQDMAWAGSGVAMGVAFSLRWYAVWAMLALAALAVWSGIDARRRASGIPVRVTVTRTLAYTGMLPLVVYLSGYLPWFARGNSLAEWIRLQVLMSQAQVSLSAGGFNNILRMLGGAYRWFISFVTLGFRVGGDGGEAAFVVLMNGFPVWLLVVPAVLWVGVVGIRRRHPVLVFAAAAPLLTYLPFVLSPRVIFLYSAIPVYVLATVCVGLASEWLLGRRAWALTAVCLAWYAYLLPLTAGIAVPMTIYAPLLRFVRIAG